MSEDIQMDVEQSFDEAPPPDARADGTSAMVNPFLHYQPHQGFLVPSQEANEGQLPDSGFGASIPPGVAASDAMHDGKILFKRPSTQAVLSFVSPAYSLRHARQPELHSLGTNDKIPAKMHIRRPGRDSWSYIGRVGVFQELTHKAPMVGM
jgi:hypothetical protein